MMYRYIISLGNGAIFGEKGLDDDVPRSATVITSRDSHMALINRKEYRQVLKDIFRLRKEK
jgi:CRP-like cAMP-binding protein